MGLLNKFRKDTRRVSIKEEIFEHLTDFLNTKRNLGVYPIDYGIDSYAFLGSDKKIFLQFVSDIKGGLEKYEKRVRDVEVDSVPNSSSVLLSFRIRCTIEEIPHTFQLSFHQHKHIFNWESSP